MSKPICCFTTLLAVAAFQGLVSLPSCCEAAPTPERTPAEETLSPTGIVSFNTLQDAGGLTEAGADGGSLNKNLSEAFIEYLNQKSTGMYLFLSDEKLRSKRAIPNWSLEGELSAATATSDFKCILRLYENGPVRRLRGQWTASSASVRYLTSNIHQDRRISRDGMVGELGRLLLRQIAACSVAQEQRALMEFARQNAAPQYLAVQVETKPEAAALEGVPEAAPRQICRVRIEASEPGQLFLIQCEAGGLLHWALPLLPPQGESSLETFENEMLRGVAIEANKPLFFDVHLAQKAEAKTPPQFLALLQLKKASSTTSPASIWVEPPAVTEATTPLPVKVVSNVQLEQVLSVEQRLLHTFATKLYHSPKGSWISSDSTLLGLKPLEDVF